MKSVFSILLVGVALFGGAFAASVPPAKIGKKCSPADGRAITECKAHIQEYMKGVEDLTEEDIKQRINIHGFKEKCAPVNQCLTSLSHCDIYGNGQMTLLTNVVRTFCNLVTYLAESPCSQKMHAHDSKCFKEWNPYLEKDDVKDENRRKEACKNYFGQNGCMRKKLIQMCGKEEWTKFRDHLINLNNLVFKQCDLRVIVWK
ncbi:hypothetical protein L5515_006050 [Caenorhabditis briggsae]|nr:hypothetical protein L3Y34_006221 [Caenorhabditis briggsae]UMM32147.1 hypothetical protein L5515_006050 [Caenorhabditis briggsae]